MRKYVYPFQVGVTNKECTSVQQYISLNKNRQQSKLFYKFRNVVLFLNCEGAHLYWALFPEKSGGQMHLLPYSGQKSGQARAHPAR